MINNTSSIFLFARPSFIEGMARVLDLGGTLQVYNESNTGREADFVAIWSDWKEVGDDILVSIREYGYESASKA